MTNYKTLLKNIKDDKIKYIRNEQQKEVDEFKNELLKMKSECDKALENNEISFNRNIDWSQKSPKRNMTSFKKDIIDDVQDILDELKKENEGIEDMMSVVTLRYVDGEQDGMWWHEFVSKESIDSFDFNSLYKAPKDHKFFILFSYSSF